MRLLLEPTPESGGGTAPPPPAAPDYAAEVARYKGDAAAMASALLAEAATLRHQADRLKADLAEARKLAPPAGSRVLTADDARKLDAYLALGEPADVARAVEDGRSAADQVRAHARERLVADAAAAYGWDAEVLAHLAGPDLELEVKDATRDGKPAKVAHAVVTSRDDAGKDRVERTPLDKFAEARWARFLPSLAPRGRGGDGLGTPSRDAARNPHPAAPVVADEPFVNIA